MVQVLLFMLTAARAEGTDGLNPLAAHLCAAFLTQPGIERVHLGGPALFALNDTLGRLSDGAAVDEPAWERILTSGVDRIDSSLSTEARVRDRLLLRPAAYGAGSASPEYRRILGARLRELRDDVTSLHAGTIAFGRVARGAEAIHQTLKHVHYALESARREQPALDRGAPFAHPWTVLGHGFTAGMLYVLGSGLWLVHSNVPPGNVSESGAGLVMTGLGATWLLFYGPEAVSFAAGVFSEKYRTLHRNRYDRHRVEWTREFLYDALGAVAASTGSDPIYGMASEGAALSSRTVDALLALGPGDTLSTEAVLETLRHGHLPFKQIPPPDRAYVFIDLVHYDGRTGEPPMLLTFLRFKKPKDLIAPRPPERDRRSAPAPSARPGAAPAGI